MATVTTSGGKTVDGWIPFTQYILPDGRREHVEISRPEVAPLADRFIEAGGKFECEMLNDYKTISLTAAFETGDAGWQDIAIKLVPNGPEVPHAVSALVEAAVQFLDAPAKG